MPEFKMSAFARYPDGSSGDAFAAVSAPSLVTCFDAMAAQVAGWLPRALARNEGEEPPQAVELRLEWRGETAQASVADRPETPSDPTCCDSRPQRERVSCARRRRLGCGGGVSLPLQAGSDGRLRIAA